MAPMVDIVDRYERFRRNVLNMQASENFICSHVRMALGSDLAARYSHIMPDGHNAYGGTEKIEEIYKEAETSIRNLFHAKFTEIRPTGGHIAAEISILSTVSKGGVIMAIPEEFGGYTGYMQPYIPDMFSMKYEPIPYNGDTQEIIYDEMDKKAKELKPQAIVLGQSFCVRHYDLKRIREIADSVQSKILYDGSHPMGLIAGKKFQADALQYSDILYGSTHKTFFGPQGGIILTNDENIYSKIQENTVWKTFDNYHPNHVAALGIAAQDLIQFGESYASWVVSNSVNLARSLEDSGIIVKYGPWYTESHQVILSKENSNKFGDFREISRKLENNNIIVDTEGRIGTSEITRLGLTDMMKLGQVISDAIKGKDVRKDVTEILRNTGVKYCR
jgi:glycine hydroxymethyltransferase